MDVMAPAKKKGKSRLVKDVKTLQPIGCGAMMGPSIALDVTG